MRRTNCPSSMPMTPYLVAMFLMEVSSVAAVAAVTCLTGGMLVNYGCRCHEKGEEGGLLIVGGYSTLRVSVILGVLDYQAGVVSYLEPFHPTN